MTPGMLLLVATPIGNLGDITVRALETLRSVDTIACEDTRVTRRLLSRYGIATRLVSYREGTEEAVAPRLLEELWRGRSVALVTDAGVPLISDPGYVLLRRAVAAGIPVDVIPGPSAVTTALGLSALPPEPFAFFGFLPRKGSPRSERLRAIAAFGGTVVLFESPRRIAACLTDLAALDKARPAAVVRELTKIHQEVVRGTLEALAGRAFPAKGEYTVVLGPPRCAEPQTATPHPLGPSEAAALLAEAGVPARTIRDLLAHLYGLRRRDAYRMALARGDRAGK